MSPEAVSSTFMNWPSPTTTTPFTRAIAAIARASVKQCSQRYFPVPGSSARMLPWHCTPLMAVFAPALYKVVPSQAEGESLPGPLHDGHRGQYEIWARHTET